MSDAATKPALSNLPDVTVSELSGAIKRTMEDAFGVVRVRGEVSGYRGPHSSGHVYFCLKDQHARIDAVIWKGSFARVRFRPEEGMEVIATGKVSTFPGSSKYQIIVEQLEPAGVGALLAQVEERRRRLAAEGLFDPAAKRPLPYLPAVIGVVTSPTGAVIRDIAHRIGDRFPRRVIVWPVRVQGEGSAREVAQAIRGFAALPAGGKVPRPDVLIVARGGGSLEDLWGFNDEEVVRAVAACTIPVISAVGHETDWTLIDHVADVRAPTPTAAAEMAVPVRSELAATLLAREARMLAGLRRGLEQRRTEWRGAARALPTPEALLAPARQRLDVAQFRLAPALTAGVQRSRARWSNLCNRLERRAPRAALAERRGQVLALGQRLARAGSRLAPERRAALLALGNRLQQALKVALAMEASRLAGRRERLAGAAARLSPAALRGVTRQRERLLGLAKLLASVDHANVLRRGFALVRGSAGEVLTSRHAAAALGSAPVSLHWADGSIGAVLNAEARPTLPRPRPRKAAQDDLFG